MAQFKQGVKSVAGKLSVLANGVMTSIQVSKAAQADVFKVGISFCVQGYEHSVVHDTSA